VTPETTTAQTLSTGDQILVQTYSKADGTTGIWAPPPFAVNDTAVTGVVFYADGSNANVTSPLGNLDLDGADPAQVVRMVSDAQN
jgi:hypothetical protein